MASSCPLSGSAWLGPFPLTFPLLLLWLIPGPHLLDFAHICQSCLLSSCPRGTPTGRSVPCVPSHACVPMFLFVIPPPEGSHPFPLPGDVLSLGQRGCQTSLPWTHCALPTHPRPAVLICEIETYCLGQLTKSGGGFMGLGGERGLEPAPDNPHSPSEPPLLAQQVCWRTDL